MCRFQMYVYVDGSLTLTNAYSCYKIFYNIVNRQCIVYYNSIWFGLFRPFFCFLFNVLCHRMAWGMGHWVPCLVLFCRIMHALDIVYVSFEVFFSVNASHSRTVNEFHIQNEIKMSLFWIPGCKLDMNNVWSMLSS